MDLKIEPTTELVLETFSGINFSQAFHVENGKVVVRDVVSLAPCIVKFEGDKNGVPLRTKDGMMGDIVRFPVDQAAVENLLNATDLEGLSIREFLRRGAELIAKGAIIAS